MTPSQFDYIYIDGDISVHIQGHDGPLANITHGHGAFGNDDQLRCRMRMSKPPVLLVFC